MQITIPSIDNPFFKKLESKINADFEPIELDCEYDSNDKALDCFNIVKQKVENFGGKIILGWQIWQTKFYIEAEAHAVWEDENGDLHDISPKANNFQSQKILFIEDSRMKYEDKQIDSIRINITNNKVVDDFISASKLFFHLRNKGIRAFHFDLSEILNNDEINEIQEVLYWRVNLERFMNNNKNEKSKCFCGGEKSYKNCHHEVLLELCKMHMKK